MLSYRVLMITPFYKKQRGNKMTVDRLTNNLNLRGFKIEVLTLEKHDWASHLHDRLSNNDFDLIHAFNASYCHTITSQVPDIKFHPLIMTLTGTDINVQMPKQKDNDLLKCIANADALVVFNETFIDTISSYSSNFQNKIHVIPQGIYLPEALPISRNQLGLRDENILFLLPSGLRPIKNIEASLEALEIVHKKYPQVHLLIMGAMLDTAYSQKIIEQAAKLDWVTYMGEIPHQEIKGYLAAGDVVLNTSCAEGQPQAALEAMSLGKPCILTNVPGNRNIITHGQEGYYADNVKELAFAALKLAANPHLRHQMGEKAQQLVNTRFTLKQEIDAYAKLYKTIIKESGDGS